MRDHTGTDPLAGAAAIIAALSTLEPEAATHGIEMPAVQGTGGAGTASEAGAVSGAGGAGGVVAAHIEFDPAVFADTEEADTAAGHADVEGDLAVLGDAAMLDIDEALLALEPWHDVMT